MITNVTDDIFHQLKENSVLVHQTNCQGVMGAGIALQIRQKFPNTFATYKKVCDNLSYFDKKSLLGTIIYTQEQYQGKNIFIANCFGQFRYGRDKRYTEYDALEKCFEEIKNRADIDQTIVIPYKIGCNNAGGDWNIVSKIIETQFQDYPVIITQFGTYKEHTNQTDEFDYSL